GREGGHWGGPPGGAARWSGRERTGYPPRASGSTPPRPTVTAPRALAGVGDDPVPAGTRISAVPGAMVRGTSRVGSTTGTVRVRQPETGEAPTPGPPPTPRPERPPTTRHPQT